MTLKKALMSGHDLSAEEAEEVIEEMKLRVQEDDEDPEEVLRDYCLEPDYILDIL